MDIFDGCLEIRLSEARKSRVHDYRTFYVSQYHENFVQFVDNVESEFQIGVLKRISRVVS